MKEFLNRTKLCLFFINQLIVSCSNSVELDRRDFESIAEFAIETIEQKDTTSFLRLFDYNLRPQNDSMEIKKVIIENFIRAHEKSKKYQFEYIKYDFIDALSGGDLIDNDSYNVYVKVGNDYYKLRFTDNSKIPENYFSIFYFDNLSFECRKVESHPYVPNMLFDHGMDWNSYDNLHFHEVKYNFYNLTEYDIDSLKFRLTIEDKNTEKILFHQTIKSDKKIYKGDATAVEVKQLRNFNTKTILSRADLSTKAKILEVYPKPKITPCTKIKKLQNLKVKVKVQ